MSKKELIPIDDKVIIKPIKQEITDGGVYMPHTDDDEAKMGKVIAVGLGLPRLHGNLDQYKLSSSSSARTNMFIKVGDTVFYPSFKGGKIDYENEEYYVFRESEILAIVREDDK